MKTESKTATTKAELLKRNGELLDQKLDCERKLKWATDSRQRWLTAVEDLEKDAAKHEAAMESARQLVSSLLEEKRDLLMTIKSAHHTLSNGDDKVAMGMLANVWLKYQPKPEVK